jgi:hypothetical protein
MLMNRKHMKSATTKYSEINTPRKFNSEIFGLTSTLEKPTRGKPVRGDFYYLQSSEKEFLTTVFFRNLIHRLISIFVPTHRLKMCAKQLLDFCAKKSVLCTTVTAFIVV